MQQGSTQHHHNPRDLDHAQKALVEVQSLLRKQKMVENVVHHQPSHINEERQRLVQTLVHRQHTSELAHKLEALHPADVAYVLECLPPEDRLLIWQQLPASRDGEILLELSDAVRETLIRSMDRQSLMAATETLDAEDIADLAADLPKDVVDQLASGLSLEDRERLRAAMSYPEDTVGACMDFDMVTIRDDVTLEVVLRYLKRFDALPEQTDQIFVVDRTEHFLGSLSFETLLINEPDVEVAKVMRRDVLQLQGTDDVSDAAQAFERYDLVSAPVLDVNGRLIGRLTVNEVLDVIRKEAESDVLAKSGLREEEDLFASVWHSAKNRWLWLGLNLCTAFFASRVIEVFEGTIAQVVALATLMPIVAGIAGNSGNQTVTLMIRSLALSQLNRSNWNVIFKKELAVAGLNGLMWGGVAGLAAALLYWHTSYSVLLGVLMMLAIVLNLLVAACVGAVVPVCLEKLNRDPALGSSVLLTFTTDSMGFFIFLGLASLFF